MHLPTLTAQLVILLYVLFRSADIAFTSARATPKDWVRLVAFGLIAVLALFVLFVDVHGS